MKTNATILLMIGFLLCLWGVNAASLSAQEVTAEKYSYANFDNLTLELDAGAIYSLCQDDEGLMWLGTSNGLYSYNGFNTHSYIDRSEAGRNIIQALLPLGSSRLCLGTDGGILFFDLKTRTFQYPTDSLSSLGAIRAIRIFQGKLWIGTKEQGLFSYDLSSRKLLPHRRADGSHLPFILTLEAQGDKLYIGSYDGLSCYDSQKKTLTDIEIDPHRRIMCNSLLWDEKEKRLWVGTEGWLYLYDAATNGISQTSIAAGHTIKTLTSDKDGHLLIGTDAGLYIYDTFRNRVRIVTHDSRNPQSLCNNIIWTLFKDREQNIWLGTNGGLSLAANGIDYKTIPLSELTGSGKGNLFTCLRMDAEETLWLGGENGLIHLTPTEIRWFHSNDRHHHLRHDKVRSIYEDRQRTLWIATDGGIARYDRPQGRFVFYDIKSPTGSQNADWSYDICEDGQGRLWIATYMGGIFVVEREKLMKHDATQTFHIEPYLDETTTGKSAFKLIPQGNDRIWVHTQKGIICIYTDTTRIRHLPLIADNICLFDNELWYSSAEKLYRYDERTGLSQEIDYPYEMNRKIHALVPTDEGLWFSTSERLFFYHRTDHRARIVPGLIENCQAGCQHVQGNHMIWGGQNSITLLPMTVNAFSNPSRHVSITSLSSGGKALTWGKDFQMEKQEEVSEICFNGRYDITIEMSSYLYNLHRQGNFYYRLKDNGEWNYLDNGQNRLLLAGLSGGTHTLQLCNYYPKDGNAAVISTYELVVPYPWYASQVAWVVYALLLTGIIGIVIIYQKKRTRKKIERIEKEKTLELSRLKMDFFIHISHELKTPLSLIIAPLSKLMTETSSASTRDALNVIHKNSLRLNTLIHKVLDFKQMEHESENTLIRSHVELCTLIRNCIQTFSTLIEEKQVQVDFQTDTEVLWLNIDGLKIESIFINLLSNALKHIPERDGIVTFRLHQAEEWVHIGISDNGTGIRKEELPWVFVRYFQSKYDKEKKQGTGIGLYLVKKFVELHHGKVEVRSQRGVQVEMSLPIIGENAIDYGIERETDAPEGLPTDDKTVLIIDDNREIVAFLAQILSAQYRCIKAYDGKEGEAVIARQHPDLIIVDQMMPVMDGFEFCRRLRRNQPTASIPVIMLTAKDDMETEMESIKIGVDAFFSKPFDIRKMQLRIAQLLQKRKLVEKSMRIEGITHPDFERKGNVLSSDEQLLEQVTKTIEENMDTENFTVMALAEIVNVDQKQLYRKVKQLTGMTPVNYIRKLKMKKAAVLLRQERFTVSEVMYMVGYSNLSYFIKCFSTEFGATPKRFCNNSL